MLITLILQDYIYTLTNQRWTNMKTHSTCLDPVTAWRAAFEIDPWTYFWERTFLDVSFQWLSCLNLAGFQSKSNLYIRKLPSSKVKDLENYDLKNMEFQHWVFDFGPQRWLRREASSVPPFFIAWNPTCGLWAKNIKEQLWTIPLNVFQRVFFHFTGGVFLCGAAWSWMSLHRSIDLAWPRSLHQVTMEDGRTWRMWTVRMLSCLCCATHRHQVARNWGETMLKFVKVNIF